MPIKISQGLDLNKAYDRVILDERRGEDFIPDLINFKDTRRIKNKLIRQLQEVLDKGDYKASDLAKMEVPKNNYTIRPAARPKIEDWIIYDELSRYIGQRVDRKLNNSVYSYRFDRRSGKLLRGVKQWLKFQRDFWQFFENGYQHVLVTDIASYFANINLKKLRNVVVALLGMSGECKNVVKLLFERQLYEWSRKELNEGFGIPQGITASSILGNIFLHNVDAHLSRNRKIKYLRYVDDMKVLAKDSCQAKIALKVLIKSLREIGLDVNAKKTTILAPDEVERHLRDPREKDLILIDDMLDLGDKEVISVILPSLRDIFLRSFDTDNPFSDRHMRFTLNRYMRLRKIIDEEAVTLIISSLLENLDRLPGSADLFCTFLSMFPTEASRIRLIKFLRSNENIYEWQEMRILDALLSFQHITGRDLGLFRKIAFDKNKHPLSRAKAILLLGKFGDEDQRYELRRLYSSEDNTETKRACIMATQELSGAERNQFYSNIKVTDHSQANLVDHIKSLNKPSYYDKVPIPLISAREVLY